MENTKPHFRVIAGRPVLIAGLLQIESEPESRVDAARRRFGGPFAHESGTNWKGPHETPVLTAWLKTNPNGGKLA